MWRERGLREGRESEGCERVDCEKGARKWGVRERVRGVKGARERGERARGVMEGREWIVREERERGARVRGVREGCERGARE